jgi:16S rRNA (adenine1518-N6/adenine1519-N6)-dimethyltransferase
MPKKLGQHFLKNKLILKKISKALELKSGDFVIEIGPGHGELTKEIIKESKGKDVKILAIEKDKNLAQYLEKSFDKKEVEVVNDDVLKVLSDIVSKTKSSYKIVGNIPYYITGRLLRIISQIEKKPTKAILMVQKEVAERICSKPPKSNLLSCIVGCWADCKIIAFASAKDFSPPPKVDSAVLEIKTTLDKRKDIDLERYFSFIKKAFKQPRKTLLNNLIASGYSRQESLEIIQKLGLKVNSRPQELSSHQVINNL